MKVLRKDNLKFMQGTGPKVDATAGARRIFQEGKKHYEANSKAHFIVTVLKAIQNLYKL